MLKFIAEELLALVALALFIGTVLLWGKIIETRAYQLAEREQLRACAQTYCPAVLARATKRTAAELRR